jgi:DNA ligase-1
MLHPRLYKTDTKGNTRFWQVEDDGAGSYRTIAGLLHGNPVVSAWTLCEAKNVGRSNETSPVAQCAAEIVSLYERKRDRHYVDTVTAVGEKRAYFEVMLAHTYDDKTKKDMFKGRWEDMWCQPKLDGLRGPTTCHGTHSRNGKTFGTVDFLSQEILAPIFADHPRLVFDGELYNHEYRDDFNEVVSIIKNGGSPEALAKARDLAELHVYDLYDPEQPHLVFHERRLKLWSLLERYKIDPVKVHRVRTDHAGSFAELDALYEVYLTEEYEGQMIRFDAAYEHKRTKMLLKRKETVSAEFPIIRIEGGKGNWAGYAKRIYVRLPDKTEGKASIKGTQTYLHGVLANAQDYVDGTATVEFQGYTPEGKLRFGRAARLYTAERDD